MGALCFPKWSAMPLLVCLVVLPGAAAVETKDVEMHLCKAKAISESAQAGSQSTRRVVRTIRISLDPAQLCVVTYTKDQKDEIVGRTKTVAGCRSIALNIRKNLEAANWNCRLVSQSQVTESKELVEIHQ